MNCENNTYSPKAKIVEVAAALLWDTSDLSDTGESRRFLICRRPPHKARGGLFEFVGGKREEGESLPQTLQRECMEEMGISVEVGECFGETVYRYPDITVRLTLFHCRILAGTPQLLEHTELRWILPAEIPLYEFCPADEDFLRELQRKYGKRSVK